ncbi:MAG: LysM peptidoglycan-binding domain-containing protein [Erysipelotrichaceae bacterium]|nr:LysM peptidoglycan-binding domain-containing protein [Erysipelotrichaceae bacterium]
MYNDEMYDMYQRRPVNHVGEIFLYVVSKGDNVWQIAKQYNSTVDMIKALNGLDENATIFPNQQLLIPVLHRRPPMGPMRDTQNQYDMYF